MKNNIEFSILDIDVEVYEQNKLIAIKKYKDGVKPLYSKDISDNNTAGYGKVDNYGYFEYPLPLDIHCNDIDLIEIQNTDI